MSSSQSVTFPDVMTVQVDVLRAARESHWNHFLWVHHSWCYPSLCTQPCFLTVWLWGEVKWGSTSDLPFPGVTCSSVRALPPERLLRLPLRAWKRFKPSDLFVSSCSSRRPTYQCNMSQMCLCCRAGNRWAKLMIPCMFKVERYLFACVAEGWN